MASAPVPMTTTTGGVAMATEPPPKDIKSWPPRPADWRGSKLAEDMQDPDYAAFIRWAYAHTHQVLHAYFNPEFGWGGPPLARQPCLACTTLSAEAQQAAMQEAGVDAPAGPGLDPTGLGLLGGKCPVCLGTTEQPTLGSCKLALERAKQQSLARAHRVYTTKEGLAQLHAGKGYMVDNKTGAIIDAGTSEWHAALREADAQLVEQERLLLRNCEDVELLERFLDLLQVLRGAHRQYTQSVAQAAAPAPPPAAAPKHDPATVCNGYEKKGGKRKRCHRNPQVWDERGHGWCRRHAHARGLLQREEVPSDDDDKARG